MKTSPIKKQHPQGGSNQKQEWISLSVCLKTSFAALILQNCLQFFPFFRHWKLILSGISYPLQNNFQRTSAEKQFCHQHFKHTIDLDLIMNMWTGCKENIWTTKDRMYITDWPKECKYSTGCCKLVLTASWRNLVHVDKTSLSRLASTCVTVLPPPNHDYS